MGLTDNWQMAKILTDNWQIAENLFNVWHLPWVLLSTDKGPDCFSTKLVPKALNSIVPLFSSASRRMPIVLGTFTSSPTKFVAYESASALVAKNARRNSLICCWWQTKQCIKHAIYCFLLLALLFRKIANMRIFHSERSNQENAYTLLYFAGILSKS